MDIITLLVIAIGLAMDCFAVSLARGAVPTTNRMLLALIFALSFGVFQTGMTIIGGVAGSVFISEIAPYDHWVGFIILTAIGLKMILEGRKKETPDEAQDPRAMEHLAPVLFLSIATSIDALAVGVSLAFLDIQILVPSLIIGVVTAGFSVAGVFLGSRLWELLGKKIEILGGAILIAIGIRILLEHLLAG
jgi:putative Mn2+ efflux pump MntP